MSSPQSPVKCDDERVAAIDKAFDVTWAVIQANEPDRDLKHDCERMAALSEKLAELTRTASPTRQSLRDSLLRRGRSGMRRSLRTAFHNNKRPLSRMPLQRQSKCPWDGTPKRLGHLNGRQPFPYFASRCRGVKLLSPHRIPTTR